MKLPSTISALLAVALPVHACLLDSELEAEREHRLHGTPIRRQQFTKRQSSNGMPIGKGDRFDHGNVSPVGLGIDDRDLESVLNPGEIQSALQGLANVYDSVELFTPPQHTYENASLHGAVIGDDPRVFIMSGIHARERGGPDNVIYLVADLLQAQAQGVGLKYGNKTYTNDDVETALSAGIVILPLTNPDGVAHDQATDSCWRKNRNPKSASENSEVSIGIDLNRNFDFLFNYLKAFSDLAETSSAASDDPHSEIFHGLSPASEPETQAIIWSVEQFDGLSWFLDLHSYGGDILYAWGDDNAQHTDTSQNFKNATYDGTRGFLGDDPEEAKYKEFFEKEDWDAELGVAEKMSKAMDDAGSIHYTPLETVLLYPTSGTSTDYMHGLYYGGECGQKKLRSLTVEFGQPAGDGGACPFYPSKEEYHDSMRSVDTGLMELLLNAAGPNGEPQHREC
ncbi:zinc carboxypeptidase domain-containing protein [Sarocladium implicatum]|nr:zinc carboxypeptidase domain-containing protein [Sarocladium implicatum]